MLTERRSGVLLHPTALPGPYGIGDLGDEARQFLTWLRDAGQSYWQILPLSETAGGDSPYQSPSAFAGNSLLISPDRLYEDGLITRDSLTAMQLPQTQYVDFAAVRIQKEKLLAEACRSMAALPAGHSLQIDFERFRSSNHWLEEFSLYMSLCDANERAGCGLDWSNWHESMSWLHRDSLRREFEAPMLQYELQQFLFFRQWSSLREFARELGIRIFGDVPIYVSYDSADVWANRSLFQLDERGHPTHVSGVPPDYFSATGQLWKNPLYRWEDSRDKVYDWWKRRLRAVLSQVDLVRLDHFRGFEAYWSVPAGETTAIHGAWVPGPRDDLFVALQKELVGDDGSLEDLALVAEDLGMITQEVHDLRNRFGLPGMKVLQFMLPGDEWDEPANPATFEPNSVVYTGTHDNDTTRGWFDATIAVDGHKLERLRRRTPGLSETIAWEMIELAWGSGSNLAIAPLQDLLSLDSSARFNTPGTSGPEFRNWCWRVAQNQLTNEACARLAEVTQRCRRN